MIIRSASSSWAASTISCVATPLRMPDVIRRFASRGEASASACIFSSAEAASFLVCGVLSTASGSESTTAAGSITWIITIWDPNCRAKPRAYLNALLQGAEKSIGTKIFWTCKAGTARAGVSTGCASMNKLPFIRLIEHTKRRTRFTNFVKKYANLAHVLVCTEPIFANGILPVFAHARARRQSKIPRRKVFLFGASP